MIPSAMIMWITSTTITPIGASGAPNWPIPTTEKRSERPAEIMARGRPILGRLVTVPMAASDMITMTGPPYMNILACQEGKTERSRVSTPTPVMTDIARSIESARRPMIAREVILRSMPRNTRAYAICHLPGHFRD